MNAADALLAYSGDPEIKVIRGVSWTEYLITGSLSAIFREIERLFAEWPPGGYGTRVHHIDSGAYGLFSCRMSHANSAD